MSDLAYTARYRIEDDETPMSEIVGEAKMRWISDVIALDCRPTGEANAVTKIVDVDGEPWVEITAPVRRLPYSTWPEGRAFMSNPAPKKAAA